MRVLLGGRLETTIVQRRRKAKSKPRDVFSGGSQNQRKEPQKTPQNIPNSAKKPVAIRPPSKPSPKADLTPKPQEEANSPKKAKITESSQTKEIIESQILGESRKSIGLRNKEAAVDPEVKESATSKRAQDIIDKSRARAMESLVKKASENIEAVKPATVVTKKRTRKTKTSFQPAERKKRLDRSRHMEYKYEVRGLLVDLNVDEEHRSSILGTVWAKGERQTVSDAKEYLNTKLSEGVIDDIQLEALTKVVDNYTIRR